MKLFFYTEKDTIEVDGEKKEIRKLGYSFDLEKVIMTYPTEDGLSVSLSHNADKINPVEYKYKVDPKTKQRVPVKVSKFEITSEPVTIELKYADEINSFLAAVGGPELNLKDPE